MSDTPQGPGWWQASDGRWYPPEQAPGAASGGAGAAGGATVDIGAGLSYAWAKFQANVGQWILLALVPMAVYLVVSLIAFFALIPAFAGDAGVVIGTILFALVLMAGIVVAFVMSRGLYRAALGVCDGREPDVGLLFKFDDIGPFIIVSLLYALAVGVGMVLCVIPGIIAAVVFVWAPYAVIDKGMAPVDAMKHSLELTKERAGEVVLFLIVIYAINAVAGSVCFLLSLVTLPVMWIALAWAWRRLNGQPVAP